MKIEKPGVGRPPLGPAIIECVKKKLTLTDTKKTAVITSTEKKDSSTEFGKSNTEDQEHNLSLENAIKYIRHNIKKRIPIYNPKKFILYAKWMK